MKTTRNKLALKKSAIIELNYSELNKVSGGTLITSFILTVSLVTFKTF